MDTRFLALGLTAAVVAAGFLLAAPQNSGAPDAGEETPADRIGEPGSEHLHAYLFFAVNGSERPLGPPYLEQSSRVHFHGNDSIIHVHADNVDLGYALQTLDIAVNSTCIRFRPENTSVCGEASVRVNGEPLEVGDAVDRDIQQGDTIVVWLGPEGPGRFPQDLPPQYRETDPGKQV
ncbi:MAG: hypothetical protein SVW77_03830 [Candidatus Nanohaloarchaea archaeon]|nr:hypothetical protein [Candidatus Nanohaloarchaea archaeon]